MSKLIKCVLLLLQLDLIQSFYLPGVAPQSWNDGSPVKVEVDSLTSPKTRLPYDYYDFPFWYATLIYFILFFFRYFTLNHFRFPFYFFSFNILVVQNKVLLQRVKRWVKFLLVVVRNQPTMIYEWRKMSTVRFFAKYL